MLPKLPCVLLVDDDPTTNFLNRKLLERLAVADQVLVALNGQEALTVLEAQCAQQPAGSPLLVLLDVNMPVMNGLQFLEAYQQLPADRQCPTVMVMLTTSAHPQDVQRAQQLPVADFLSKPLTQEKVERVLYQHFGGR
jgi:CheY-like chemotaxis protein